MVKTVNILGNTYDIKINNYGEDPLLSEDNSEGYCIPELKEIVLCNMETFPDCPNDKKFIDLSMKTTLRHEIIHAFLYESGVYGCSSSTEAWAMNEEMVDWLALQSPKILKAFAEAKAI